MADINLHFTGDFHAITTAHNLLSAMLDNHIHQGNELNIDIHSITWKRVMDMNERALQGHRDRPRRQAERHTAGSRASTSPPPRRSWRCFVFPKIEKTSRSGSQALWSA